MIFLRYESLGQYFRMYRVTSVILLINILFFIETSIRGNDSILLQNGVLFHSPPYNMEIWRYFLSMFLHASFDHALFNLFAIFVFAPPLERFLGRWNYALLYIGAGLAGNIASLLFNAPNVVSVGASGAIFGIYGAYIYLIAFRGKALDEASRKTIQILLVMGLVYTFLIPRVNIYAHLGGFVGGFLMFSTMLRRRS